MTVPTTCCRWPRTSPAGPAGATCSSAPPRHGRCATYGWPGNVDQLHQVVTRAASRTDVIDVANLPSEVLAGNGRHLSRIEAFECGEIVRVLGTGSPTMAEAAHELGMSRATLYRKISQYGIDVPR